MHSAAFTDLDLEELWSERTPDVRSRSAYVTHWLAGTKGSAAVYFELDPGMRFGAHRHSAEETIVVVDGEVELTVGDECRSLQGLALGVAPALLRHDIRNSGDRVARCIGFWPAASVVSIWDEPLQPRNSRRAGTPIPEGI